MGMESVNQYRLICFTNDEDIQYLDKLGRPHLGNDVFRNILKYVMNRLSCKCILEEKKYIDIDYRNEYSNLYSKTFTKFDSTSTRLHFFGKEIKDISEIFDYDLSSLNYLGYVLLRPINIGKVGRTILRSHREFDDTFYPLCTENFSAHLFGREFIIHNGTPFISQDTMVMACAQASIWTATHYLHKKFKFPRVLPFDITENASKSLGWDQRKIPTVGLTVFQMMNALNNMGYSPVLFSKPMARDYFDNDEPGGEFKKDSKNWIPLRTIYSYVESGIPVLISVPKHAMTVIGHTFDPNPAIRLKKEIEDKIRQFDDEIKKEGKSDVKLILPSYLWTNGFVIQDDNCGPFRILPIEDEDFNTLKDYSDLLPTERNSYKTVQDIEHVIVPLPEKVYLLGHDAYNVAEKLLAMTEIESFLLKSFKEYQNESARDLWSFMQPEYEEKNPVIIRCYFMDSSEYKKKILNETDSGLHAAVKDAYLKMNLPHYIWIAEVTTANFLCNSKENERRIYGEILIDSTANKYDSSRACLSMHLPGLLLANNFEPGQFFMEPFFFDKDYPYAHISRKI